MNLESHRQLYSDAEKRAFYESAAKRFKAELRLTGAYAAIHIENKNDEVFWGKILQEALPGKKFRFISSSRNISGNITTGCTQCLQYRPFLDSHLWIAIDSDYRYLSEEPHIDAQHYILQTYAYSFENHFCYPKNCQRAVLSNNPGEVIDSHGFSFANFLRSYSKVIYPLLVWQIYLQDIDREAFPKSVFHRLLSLPVGPRSLARDGEPIIQLLKERTRKLLSHLKKTYPDADTTWYEERCHALGVRRDNCYLFVRGHQLYDLIVAQGKKLNRNFEKELLKELCFGDYDEIKKIHDDILLIERSQRIK